MTVNSKLAIVFIIVLSVGVYMYIQSVAEKNVAEIESSSSVVVPKQATETAGGVFSGGNSNTSPSAENSQAAQTPKGVHTKGEVVSIDISGKNIKYKPYMFATVGTDERSMTFSENIPVYRVDDAAKMNVADARVAATLADIQPGQVIFIGLDDKPLETGQFVPNEFVIVSGK